MSDDLPAKDLTDRIQAISKFSYNYIGRKLTLDAIAIRSTRRDAATFAATVKVVAARTDLPLILCTYNPQVMEAGLKIIAEKRPLVYAATKENWKEMADLAIRYNCPLVVSAPGDIGLLRSMVKNVKRVWIGRSGSRPGNICRSGFIAKRCITSA